MTLRSLTTVFHVFKNLQERMSMLRREKKM